MLKQILFVTILLLSAEMIVVAGGAQDVINLAMDDVGTGSAEEMKGRFFSIPITVLGTEHQRRAVAILSGSVRERRITEGKLYRRVEKIIRPVLEMHSRTEEVELFLYHDDMPQGRLWRGCLLLLSDSLAAALYDTELAGVVAHELAHSYFMDEMLTAQRTENYRSMRVIELKCDAVAILSLKLLGNDPCRYVIGLRRIISLMKTGSSTNLAYEVQAQSELKTHPSLVERALFAQRFLKVLTLSIANRQSKIANH